jgi:hypothetical protein
MGDTGQGEPDAVFNRPVFEWSIFDFKTATGAYSAPVMHSASLQKFIKMLFAFFNSPIGKATYGFVAQSLDTGNIHTCYIEPGHFVYYVTEARRMPIRHKMTIGFVIFMIERIVGKDGLVNKATRLLEEFDKNRGMTQWKRDEGSYERRYEELSPVNRVGDLERHGMLSEDDSKLIHHYMCKMASSSDTERLSAVGWISSYVRHHPASDHVLASAVRDRNPIIRNAASKVFADYLKYCVDDAEICHDLTIAELEEQLSRLADTGVKKLFIIGCEFAPNT